MPYQQSIHKLIIMLPLLQESGDLDLQRFNFSRQRFVPGFRGFQLLLHVLVVFQEGLVFHRDPLYSCGRRARPHEQIDISVHLQFLYTHLKRLPLLLLHGADVAEVPVLRRGFLEDPHAQKLFFYTQDAWLSSLS